jgi:hypothetical protein
MNRGIAVAVTLISALALAGCGGDGGDETLSPSEWADSLCSDLGEWKSSMQTVAASFGGGNLSQENVQDAADEVSDATEMLVGDLQDLGRPDTESGQEAKDEVDNLSEELQTGSDEIQRAADGVSSAADVPQAAATAGATLTRLRTQLTTTLTNLEQIEPQGEVKSALEQSDACNDLKSS